MLHLQGQHLKMMPVSIRLFHLLQILQRLAVPFLLVKQAMSAKSQNVAAGRISATSTDAINGSQLHAVLNNSGFNVQENGSPKSRINNNDVVNFKDGNLTTANVTKTPNGTIVKFDVNTTNITTNATQVMQQPQILIILLRQVMSLTQLIKCVICQLLSLVIAEVRSKNWVIL